VYDTVFEDLVDMNPEGQVLVHDARGFPFDHDVIEHLTTSQPMQAAGAAVLSLAWNHREVLSAL
jgi:hypothetical protein